MSTQVDVIENATVIANVALVVTELAMEILGNDTALSISGSEITRESITSLVVASINNEFGAK